MTELRRTPLYPLQQEAGARFVEFAGWEMPVQYSGVVDEHQAVRTAAGLFDVSHMGELLVTGPQAIEAMDYAVTNHVAKLATGRALYTVMCTEEGGIIDDLIIYRVGPEELFVVVNASRVQEDVAHLREVTAKFDCTLTDISERTALLALQGPKWLEILSPCTELPVAGLAPFSFIDGVVAGAPNVRVAATGYTGEPGVELYLAATDAPAVWRALMESGAAHGLKPCGLGARDTLRLEMKYPLYGQDITVEHNPLEAGLGWVVKLKKGNFVGREALARIKDAGPTRKLVGVELLGRGIPRPGYELQVGDTAVGAITSGTHSPSLGKAIGMGYVAPGHAQVGTQLDVMIRGRAVPAQVVETPFYKRPG